MTPPTTPTDSERTPRTTAGRAMLARRSYWEHNDEIRSAILAIEAEAAALPERAGLDGVRLARALVKAGVRTMQGDADATARRIVIEYAALTAPAKSITNRYSSAAPTTSPEGE